jgi:nucleotidyltransferase substrate binding protein (TIGR01987 family)
MKDKDIRWIQRFSNFAKAFKKLEQAVQKVKSEYATDDDGNISDDAFLDDIIKEGVIQRFEYTHELAWKVIRDYFKEVGGVQTIGSKDATREAFAADLISNGDVWMDMIQKRNLTSHTYNEETADEIFELIINTYCDAFSGFYRKMEALRTGQQGDSFKS